MKLQGIEICFAIECEVTSDQLNQIRKVINDVIDANTPEGHVHWLFGEGHKVLWREPEEPDFDPSIQQFTTSCRPKMGEEL